MGSLNDYGRGDFYGHGPEGRGRRGGRLLRQCLLAAALFCAVAALVGSDGLWGEAARYVAGPGLAPASSWLKTEDGLQQVDAAPDIEAESIASPATADAVPDSGDAAAETTSDDGDTAETPRFTAPASGVVVSELAVTAGGSGESAGILIQGSAGQRVRAAAAGTVRSVSDENGLFRLELEHSGGFTSIYQGLSQIDVAVGDTVSLGDPVGACAGGELRFSLLRQGEAVDPLEYLFN